MFRMHADIVGHPVGGGGVHPADKGNEIEEGRAISLDLVKVLKCQYDLGIGARVFVMGEPVGIRLQNGARDGIGLAIGQIREQAEHPDQ